MFTGIVEEMGIVRKTCHDGLDIKAHKVMQELELGESICVNGACLTVVAIGGTGFSVDLAEETQERTNLSSIHMGALVNLERAVVLGHRMGGHIVQGHVDGIGKILSMEPRENSMAICISASTGHMKYVVEKGFIAVDGISLTVTECDVSSFTVSVIPYTLRNTSLGQRQRNDTVNLEVDILSKYVERLLNLESNRRFESGRP